MSKKQTAVEWLIEKLDTNLDINHSWRTRQYIEQAKQMEKEQICNAYLSGIIDPLTMEASKQSGEYYNLKYGK